MSARNPEAAGRLIHARTVSHMLAAATAETGQVALLVDAGVAILDLVTGLASAGLTLRHDQHRGALVIAPSRSPEIPRS